MWTEFGDFPQAPMSKRRRRNSTRIWPAGKLWAESGSGAVFKLHHYRRVQTMIDGDEAKSGLACTPNGLTMPRAFRHPEHRVAMIQTLHGNEVSRNG